MALSSGVGDGTVVLTKCDLHAWDQLLRHAPEYVPTIDRDPVVLPVLPDYQTEMWTTLLDLERLGRPWVLVGGQMTLLHCLENGVSPSRSTDDADVVVGVWTRRDALRRTSAFLQDHAFVEDQTNDGYGYRFRRGRTVIDVLVPEGLERQRDYPRTTAGHPGFAARGGNQALIRAERVPVVVAGSSGYLRRPNLLGSIVVKPPCFRCRQSGCRPARNGHCDPGRNRPQRPSCHVASCDLRRSQTGPTVLKGCQPDSPLFPQRRRSDGCLRTPLATRPRHLVRSGSSP